ncbi:MAG: recombinase family protein [Selenomonadales bacterium]|nr:recombinase family protein [Selenomonadales bacterium]
MLVGYIRVSTAEQNTARQESLMRDLGVEKVFVDHASGKDSARPELKKLLDFVREGDSVVVESVSRFARNTRELLHLVALLHEKRVEFISRKENIDTNSPAGKFMLTVFGAMAELERDYILQRQAEGVAIAKRLGKYKGRKKIEVEKAKFRSVYEDWKTGKTTAVKAMARLNLTRSTFYRRVREYEAGQ